jgi:hypothetical protein
MTGFKRSVAFLFFFSFALSLAASSDMLCENVPLKYGKGDLLLTFDEHREITRGLFEMDQAFSQQGFFEIGRYENGQRVSMVFFSVCDSLPVAVGCGNDCSCCEVFQGKSIFWGMCRAQVGVGAQHSNEIEAKPGKNNNTFNNNNFFLDGTARRCGAWDGAVSAAMYLKTVLWGMDFGKEQKALVKSANLLYKSGGVSVPSNSFGLIPPPGAPGIVPLRYIIIIIINLFPVIFYFSLRLNFNCDSRVGYEQEVGIKATYIGHEIYFDVPITTKYVRKKKMSTF